MSKDMQKPTQPSKPFKMGGGPRGMTVGEKPKNFKAAILKLLKYTKKYFVIIMLALGLAIAGSVFTIIAPDKLGKITNIIAEGIITGIDMAAIKTIGVTLVVLYALSAAFNYTQGYIMSTVTQKVAKGLRTDISKKINILPLKYFDKVPYGDILSRVSNDVDSISETLNHNLVVFITSSITIIGTPIKMFLTNYIMAFTAIIATFLGSFLMVFILKSSQKYFIKQQASLGAMNGHIEEVYSGHNIVKTYNAYPNLKQEFDNINHDLYDSGWKSQFISGIMYPLMNFIANFGFVAVCIVGGMLAVEGVITIGVIASFMVYIRLFNQPIGQLAQVMTSLQTTAAATERVFEFLDEKELSQEKNKINKIQNVKGDITFKNLKFGYDKNKLVIKDFSAHITAGQKVAIVGPTGAGKTTLVNLIMRFYEAQDGEILLDGTNINKMTRSALHQVFAMVLQDTWIFNGTIKENIIFNQTSVTDEEVINACKMAGIDHFIRTLPNGYDTILDDNMALSNGQKQLLTIARAMLKESKILILDEATSSVDTRLEIIIQNAMDKLTENKTSFIIAHRLSTIKNADIILVMKDGDIIESGNHNDLIKQKGFYAELYNSQFINT